MHKACTTCTRHPGETVSPSTGNCLNCTGSGALSGRLGLQIQIFDTQFDHFQSLFHKLYHIKLEHEYIVHPKAELIFVL